MEKYDDEFKRNALEKVFDGQSVRSVAEESGVNEFLIHKWKRAAEINGDGVSAGKELAAVEALRKRRRELEVTVATTRKPRVSFRDSKRS